MVHPPHFFKYCSAHVAQLVLTNRKVRWNSPLNFNDPFDCYFSLDAKFDINEMTKKRRERFLDLMTQPDMPDFDPSNPHFNHLSTIRKLAEGLTRNQIDEKLGDLFEQSGRSLENLGSIWRQIWKKLVCDFRLLCVCEVNSNLLLWTHYAQNHTGIAFQFECIQELDVPLLAARPVVYSKEPPGLATEDEWLNSSLGLRPLNTGEEVARRLLTTKTHELGGEKEWRVITMKRPYENQGYEDIPFFPQEISKLFLGCRIKESDRADILSLLSGPFAHAEVYQARQHPKKYEIEFDRIK